MSLWRQLFDGKLPLFRFSMQRFRLLTASAPRERDVLIALTTPASRRVRCAR